MSIELDHTPKPSQLARKPLTPEDLRNSIGLSVICFVIALIGAGIWLLSPFSISSGSWETENNAVIVMFASPLMLLAGFYFLYTSIRNWRFRERFNRHKQRTQGVITHLWRDTQSNQQPTYYVGYQYGEHSAYQDVPKRQFNALTIGKNVWVEYLPDDPSISYFEPIQGSSKRKKTSDMPIE